MKKIACCAGLMLYLLCKSQQLPSQEKKVSFETDGIPASEAVHLIFTKYNIQNISPAELAAYKTKKVKCEQIAVTDCLKKLLDGLPFKVIRHKSGAIFIKNKRSEGKSTVSNETVFYPSTDMKTDTIGTTANINKIDEIVVNAGYYKVKEKERTGSIAKVTAKDIENQPVTNVLSTMQGRMAGVSITQNSGVPGGGFDVQIRGKNSLRSAGNSPLYIINGVPVGNELTSLYSGAILPANSINPLNSINPNDIESIEVLKDADATAIYGSRGANGVILITTKTGKNGKLSLSLNSAYAVSSIISNLKMMNTTEYLAVRDQAFKNDGLMAIPTTAFDINGTWDRSRYTDWTKTLIGKTADLSQTHLSLNGGNEMTNFLISYGHTEQSTVFQKGFKYKTDNISSTLSHRSADRRFVLNITNLFSIQKNNVVTEDITKKAFYLSPNAPALYDDQGELNWNNFNNPIAVYNTNYKSENLQYLSNINIDYKLLKNVLIKLNGGINYQTFEEWSLKPNTIYNPIYASGQSSAFSQAFKNNQNRFSYIVEPQFSWKIKKKYHSLDFLFGGTFQSEINNQGSITGIGFESNALIQNIGSAKTKIISDQLRTEYRYAAIFGRLNYQYKDRYILNLTGRRDGSSRFGTNNKFANFGAIGAAWIFSKEKPLVKQKWLSFGKLRASLGTAGNDNIGDYQYWDTYTVSSQIYDNTAGLNPSRLYNPNFSWEKTTKLEFAVDLGFLKNRLNLSAQWYRNRSSNQLLGYQLPISTGFSSVLANLPATVQNTGLEFEFGAHILSSSTFQWESNLNISFPRNKLISFPNLEGSTYANSYQMGAPVTMVKVYQFEGIDQQTGLYRFKDYNNDGKITAPDDKQVIEDLGIRFFGGWSNTFHYKNWDLSLLFQFVKQYNWNYNRIMMTPGTMNNQPVEVLDVWSPENPTGYYMPYASENNGTKNGLHTLFTNSTAAISDASFIRLKNIQLAYNIPLKDHILNNVKIYFQGQNLLTITKYFGIDPEFRNIGYLPPLKTYTFGIQANF